MTELRKEAEEYGDVIGVCLVVDGDVISDPSHTYLCIDCAEIRGITLYTEGMHFVHEDPGMLPVQCQDCGKLLA